MFSKGLAKAIFVLLFIVGCGGQYESVSSSVNGLSFVPATPPPLCSKGYQGRAIYGEDNRLEWHEAPPIAVAWARSTLALMMANQMSETKDSYVVVSQTYAQASNLCPQVPFARQPSAAYCSGFLVSKDLVVTAGHCIRSREDCAKTLFVFDYAKTSTDQATYSIPKESVYRCQDVVTRSIGSSDYAVVRLDQEVVGRTPLNLRRSGAVPVGHELMLIGHPSGIPSKIADGGIVRRSGDTIIASVDAFAGNSGSPVINMSTGLVEGILVAGEPDFLNQGSCRIENRCGPNCQGEQITPISKVLSYIPNLTYESPSCDGSLSISSAHTKQTKR